MKSNYPVEVVPAQAINEALSGTPTIIIDTTGNHSILEALSKMYPLIHHKVYYTRPGIDNLAKLVERCNSLGLKNIVLSTTTPPQIEEMINSEKLSAALISAGSQLAGGTVTEQLLSLPNLDDFTLIGYQRYHTNPKVIEMIVERQFEHIRLGVLRNNISLVEPMIRNKETLFLDLDSVRFSDFPDNSIESPNGLYAEEICQLSRYVGMGNSLNSFFIFGIPQEINCSQVSIQLVAEIIWHTVEAFAANINEDPADLLKEDIFLKKIVSMGDKGEEIIFVKSRSTGRWWIEIPRLKESSNVYVPCSEEDYILACSQEVPLRWLFFFQKFNPN